MEKRTILFVDDEVKVLNSLKRGLLDEPYETLFAKSGADALELLEKQEVHIIVTDMRMPGMTGLELLRAVKKKYPHIVRLALSGYTQIDTLLTTINQGEIFKFITKPWKLEEGFKTVLQQSIDYYNLQEERDRLAAEVKRLKTEKGKVSAGT